MIRILIKINNYTIIYPLAIIFVILVRVVKPIILIRFGKISSYIFGHFVFDTEYYLSEKYLKKTRSLDLFYYHKKNYPGFKLPNKQWDLMVRRKYFIHALFKYLYYVNNLLPGGDIHLIKMNIEQFKSRDPKGVLRRTKTNVCFTESENENGKLFLEEIGLSQNDKYVCLMVRDARYKEEFNNWKKDWSYHNHRDSEIETYTETAIELAKKGYWVFRMGKTVHKKFNCDHPKVLDYANSSYRTDFLDIWLCANCFFFISTLTGLDNVCTAFRKPGVYVNQIGPFSLLPSWTESVIIPKNVSFEGNDKCLSLTELLKNDFSKYHEYLNNKMIVINNKSKEIKEAVIEMEERLNGKWRSLEIDTELQTLFWRKFKAGPKFDQYHGDINPGCRIGASYLRNNYEWFLAD